MANLPVRKYAISLIRYGCTNRPFYHVVIAKRKHRVWEGDIIEHLGSFDPIPNRFNEKLVALNFERVRYWLGQPDTTAVSVTALELFGYCGILPLHPRTYVNARITKNILEEFDSQLKKHAEKQQKPEASSTVAEKELEKEKIAQ